MPTIILARSLMSRGRFLLERVGMLHCRMPGDSAPVLAYLKLRHYPEEGLRGRQTQKKALVAIAAEEDGAGIGRIRMKRIRGASKQQLHGFIQEAVEPDSTIHTDGWEGYVSLEALGYRHEYDFLAGSSQSASELLPHVHRVAALLKRWLIGTHQGAVSREHLDYYLDEYTFRFNRRRSRHRGKLFYRLVQQAATVGPTTYSEMVQHLRGRRTGQPQDVG